MDYYKLRKKRHPNQKVLRKNVEMVQAAKTSQKTLASFPMTRKRYNLKKKTNMMKDLMIKVETEVEIEEKVIIQIDLLKMINASMIWNAKKEIANLSIQQKMGSLQPIFLQILLLQILTLRILTLRILTLRILTLRILILLIQFLTTFRSSSSK